MELKDFKKIEQEKIEKGLSTAEITDREARAFFERLTSTQASRVVQTRPDDIFAISKEDVLKTLGGC
ncbi:hypothetical protein [Urinicoccus massiliensis]|uniref:hypothetical protein n=1 Tax=Urinicoccus massiliensis TaxID=1723382 RepID=UPI00093136FD|nr:hypothetical protein [Urinicoccus massiliensis]